MRSMSGVPACWVLDLFSVAAGAMLSLYGNETRRGIDA